MDAETIGDLSRAARLNVAVDGEAIENDPLHENGFAVVDATHVELYGDACEAWLAAGTMSIGVCTIAESNVGLGGAQ